MRYLYKRGDGVNRRVMHLTPFDSRTGQPTMQPLCDSTLQFNTTCNLPLGRPICKRCLKVYR